MEDVVREIYENDLAGKWDWYKNRRPREKQSFEDFMEVMFGERDVED